MPNDLSRLSEREREVAQLVSEGNTSHAIGLVLSLSQRTVDNHIASIFRKVGVKTRAHLAAIVAAERRT
jgi:DNA-binding CsgD family transcriptional regulator